MMLARRYLPALPTLLLAFLVPSFLPPVAFATCTAPKNPIEAENCLPGTPASQWYVDGSGSPNIQGFTTDISVNVGQTIFFKISTPAASYRIDIYRLGYYQGNDGRFVTSISPSVSLPQIQPSCLTDSSTGLIDCGNWGISASWTVPSTATSGIYYAKLLRLDTGEASPLIFVVRNDSSHSDILVQTSDPTWQAYNAYGGNSFYSGNPVGRAYKVSYNRPVNAGQSTHLDFFSFEYEIVRFLEANGYDATYFTGVDTDRNGALITQHKVFMSVGHDEYWSGGQRTNVEAARDAASNPVSLIFFSGNEVFWKTRWEASIDGTSTPYRTLVCYKETSTNGTYGSKIDPADPPTWTGLWRDARFSPPADGGHPENALSGVMSQVSAPQNNAITVPQDDGRMRFWRNTSIATLGPGQVATLPQSTLGYESDEDVDNGFRPAGLIRLSTTTVAVSQYLYFSPTSGYYFSNGTETHHLTLYRARSGALVFGAGTILWSWGVDSDHAGYAGLPADPNMRQANVNLLADMGAQPATLQAGLVSATASTDTIPPTSTITSPAPGTTVTAGSQVTVSGTAQDFGGGVVGGVEVSVDGGATWHPAVGRENWSYVFTATTSGTLTVQSRAVDDSGNLEVASPAIAVAAVPPPLSVSTTSLPNGTQSSAYNQRLAAVGGAAPYSWSLFSGTLPSGLTLSTSGQISGTPTILGTSNFTVQVTDSSVPTQTATQAFNITVVGPTDPQNLAELNGNYAFTFTGIRGTGSISSVFAAVGRFTADGAGNLTNGELDTNAVGGGAAAQSFTGTYSIGADGRGVMTFNIGGGSARLAFAMMANGNAQFIEFDASGGAGTIGSGTMEKADTTAYSTARITGNYAFGAAGLDNVNNRAAIEGRFTSNGTGALTNAAGDVNAYGTDYPMIFTAANYTVSNTATGRGTMNLAFTFGGTPDSLNFVFYIVNSGKLFVMESDTITTATPLLNGVVVQQQIPAGGFTNASLNGNMVIYLTGLSICGSASGVPKAGAGLLTANGSGAFSLTYDENYCRAPNSFTAAPGTYSVASNGRTSITVGGFSLAAYLVNLNQIFLFVSDSNVLFGFGEPQAAGSFTNSTLNGTYAGFATNPVDFGVVVFSGEFSADGTTPTGNITGIEDIGSSSGPNPGVAFNATYSVSPSPTNGRGTMTVTSGTGGNAVIYMISPAKFVAVSLNDPNPAVLDFELSSAPASLSLSSLSLNPTSVTGGNSSTGTVTLSGPAPAGGAQVTLSSSNTTVARARPA